MACLNTRDNCLKLWRNARDRDYNECNAIILDGVIMATMTIRNLEDELKARLRIRAAQHGRSMEEEARSILRSALNTEPGANTGAALVKAIRARVERFGGIELELPPREPMREPPDLGTSGRDG